ncbi:MAG: iron-containing alcohol dehydrogenase [Ignavibacteria bacterium]|jgi:1,3-propanediol dehydrogenase/alcohol dehydrogenase
MNFNFHIPTEIIFGCGIINDLHTRISRKIKNILIVTDKNVYGKSGAEEKIVDQLKNKNLVVFDSVEENPSLETIERGAQLAKENNVQLVLGIGGGSPMDAAKGIAASFSNEGNLIDYINGKELSQIPLPVVCIPTTSGTGSEVTRFAVFTDSESETKVCLSSRKIFPAYSLIDPELTYSMPINTIINTGIDALTHSIEAYLSLSSFPLNDLFALESIKIIMKNLVSASQLDKDAKNKMAYASMLAGVVITHASTILLHIMAYPLTVFHKIPHGRANGILLPAFLNYMKKNSSVPEKLKIIDAQFDQHGGIENYLNKLNVSTKLTSYGIKPEEFERFANDTIVKDDINITPAKVTKDDIIEIYNSTI